MNDLEKRIFEMRIKEKALIEKYGFIVRAVPASQYDGKHANFNTHGLDYMHGHDNLQITLAVIPPEMAHEIITLMVNDIKQGAKYEDGKRYDNVIANYDVLIKAFTENGRRVLRVIFPDGIGCFPEDEACEEIYKCQIDDYDFAKNQHED